VPPRHLQHDKDLAQTRYRGVLHARPENPMTIDNQIRHVTPPDANLFAELGFSPADAAQFQAQSEQQINDTRALKAQLMGELSKWIDDNHLKQAQTAEILMVSRPRVSDVVNMKVSKFTIDTLVDMLSRIGKPVRLVVS